MLLRSKPTSGSSFGGIKVTTPTQSALLADLHAHFDARQGFTVATMNLDHVVKLRRDPEFRKVYSQHSHVVADGNPVVWLYRLAGQNIDLVTGSDMITPLAALAARLDVPVALLGSTPEALDLSAKRLTATHQGLQVVAKIAPSHGFDPAGAEADACLAEINASGARLCLIALGAPKQERFAARGSEMLPHCGFVSIGAGLDFIAGTQTRAPLWLRKIALEWLWRLAGDRRRLAKRYRDCALILPSLAASALRQRLGGGTETA